MHHNDFQWLTVARVERPMHHSRPDVHGLSGSGNPALLPGDFYAECAFANVDKLVAGGEVLAR
jgi:hypothetical protein